MDSFCVQLYMNLSPDDKKPQKPPPLSPTPPQNPNPISCQFTQASYLSVTQSGALQFTQAPMLLVTVHLLSSPQASPAVAPIGLLKSLQWLVS
jgi:hypothetical protein